MHEPKPEPPRRRLSPPPQAASYRLAERWRDHPAAGYAIAVGTTALALWLTWLAREQLDRVIFVLFWFSVTASAWLGGRRAGLFAILLAILSVDFFILPPTFSLKIVGRDALYPLLAFAAVSSLITWLTSGSYRLARDLADQSGLLQEQNIELEIQMEESNTLQEELEQTSEELAGLNDQLTRKQEFLTQAQATAQLGSWEWDIGSDRVTWSDQMFRVYGLEPGAIDVRYENFREFVHPNDREMVHDVIVRARKTGEPFAYDHRVIWPDGSLHWIHGRGRVIKDAAGKAITMIGSGQDITDRKKSADAQRLLADASEAMATSLDYKQTLKTVGDLAVRDVADWCSISIGDESGRYENIVTAHRNPERVKWAEEYARLNPPRFDTPTGVPQVLRTGKPELYPEISEQLLEASASTPEEIRVLQELQIRSAMIVPMKARDRVIGAITFIGAESRRRFDKDDLWFAERLANRAAYAIDNARLYEEAQAARADAETANAVKAQFLASMSHELRTPLNAIAGYAELIELGVLGPINEKQLDAISRLQRGRKHLSSLVDQVLSFARIEAGKIQFELTDVPVGEALGRLAEMIMPQAKAKGLIYGVGSVDSALTVYADRDRLDQILLNLLGNAVKYTPSGGTVTVTVGKDNGSVKINVADTGPGIPEEKQQVIFQPFVQLGPTADALSSGVGLGLAISRDLARAMGGDISVESRDGQGSRFTLRMPKSAGQSAT